MGNTYLVSKHETEYVIVIGKNCSKSEIHAAEELSYFLNKITGASFLIVTDDSDIKDKEIILGQNRHFKALKIELSDEMIGKEGFIIRTVDQKLVIAGSPVRGTLYGVYTFLEDFLGCRWFTDDVSHIPKRETVELPQADVLQKPILEYREPYFSSYRNADWHARNKCNGNATFLNEIHGGKISYYPFVHTFYDILPPEEYFDEHPEYFSEVNGSRLKKRGQLCLTNPEVLEIAKKKVRQWINENSNVSIISVSQNDWHNYCECKNCKALDEREESHMGTMLWFVNQIAESIEKDFPHIAIDTLAYQYTRKPPKTLRPRPNVIIRLCSIECCFSHPFTECNKALHIRQLEEGMQLGSFKDDVIKWGKICDRLYVWDYVVNFVQNLLPHPNFKVLQPNIKFLVENNVVGIFEQGNSFKGKYGELNLLKRYILAKLLWNPDYDVDTGINEFLMGYYGMSGVEMRKYFDRLHEQVNDDMHLGIYDPPTASYLTKEFLEDADKIFDEAEMLADNDIILKRIKTARLSIDYVKLATMPKETPGREEQLEEFFKTICEAGIETYIWRQSPERAEEIMRNGKYDLK
jgi:hypothetical protein